jgi:hypothetical protein
MATLACTMSIGQTAPLSGPKSGSRTFDRGPSVPIIREPITELPFAKTAVTSRSSSLYLMSVISNPYWPFVSQNKFLLLCYLPAHLYPD